MKRFLFIINLLFLPLPYLNAQTDEDLRVAGLQEVIVQMKSELETLRKQNAVYENRLKKNQIEYKDARIVELADSVSMLRVLADSLAKELSHMRGVREMYAKQQIEKEKDYPSISFELMDVKHLEHVISMCNKLGSSELDTLEESFHNAIKRKNIYDRCIESLNKPYNKENINILLSEIDTAKENSSSVQLEEMNNLSSLMRNYFAALEYFKSTLKFINRYMKDYRGEGKDSSIAIDSAFSAFSSERVTFNFNKFKDIPFILNLYVKYKQEILDNPLLEPALEKEYIQ